MFYTQQKSRREIAGKNIDIRRNFPMTKQETLTEVKYLFLLSDAWNIRRNFLYYPAHFLILFFFVRNEAPSAFDMTLKIKFVQKGTQGIGSKQHWSVFIQLARSVILMEWTHERLVAWELGVGWFWSPKKSHIE